MQYVESAQVPQVGLPWQSQGFHYARQLGDQDLANVEDMLHSMQLVQPVKMAHAQGLGQACQQQPAIQNPQVAWGNGHMDTDMHDGPVPPSNGAQAEPNGDYAHVYFSNEWAGIPPEDEHEDGTGAAFMHQMRWCIEHNLDVSGAPLGMYHTAI